MNASLLLKISAVILLLFALGHMIGAVFFYRPHTPEEAAIITSMKTYHLQLKTGSNRTLWDFYEGFAVAVGLLNFALAGVAWVAARCAAGGTPAAAALALIVGLASLAQTWLSWRYFFIMPLVLSLLAAVACAAAWVMLSARSG